MQSQSFTPSSPWLYVQLQSTAGLFKRAADLILEEVDICGNLLTSLMAAHFKDILDDMALQQHTCLVSPLKACNG